MREHKYIKKSWGSELWFQNNSKYCGKQLEVFRKYWSSKGLFHFHKIKDETFFVVEGTLLLHIIDRNGDLKPIVLSKGDSFRIRPYMKHRFTAINCEKCIFIEVSTQHFEEDSYRVELPQYKI